jgi:hypothetical protein
MDKISHGTRGANDAQIRNEPDGRELNSSGRQDSAGLEGQNAESVTYSDYYMTRQLRGAKGGWEFPHDWM